jgi:hypothetical protein
MQDLEILYYGCVVCEKYATFNKGASIKMAAVRNILLCILYVSHRFRNKLVFYGELLAPSPIPKLGGHPLSAVRDCLFNILAATLHTWRVFPPSAT